jgi:hypothetical protein
MGIPEMVGIVLGGTQVVKEFLAKLKITISGTVAIVLSVLVSAAVVIYSIPTGTPIITMITTIIQVAIAANMGYKILAGKGSTSN